METRGFGMGFLLRAALVIGVLAYASAPVPEPPRPGETPPHSWPTGVAALPPDLRARLVRGAQEEVTRAVVEQLRGGLDPQRPGAEAANR
ncbi:hypothetical protein [Methylobacterium sp. JK268]